MGNFLLRSRNNEGFRSPIDDVQLSCFLWKYEFKRRKKVLFSIKQHINSCCFIETHYLLATGWQKKREESEMKVYKSEMQNVSFLCLIIESKSDCSIFAVNLRNHLFLQRSSSPYFNLLFTCFLIIRKVHE